MSLRDVLREVLITPPLLFEADQLAHALGSGEPLRLKTDEGASRGAGCRQGEMSGFT